MALIAGVLWLAAGGTFKKKIDFYWAIETESVAGLNQNAPVKYNGVDVGRVHEIRLDPVNPQRVQLLLAMQHGTPIKTDTVAVLKTQGLTGIAYVELSGGATSAPLLQAPDDEHYPTIPTKPSLTARLEYILSNVLAKLDNTSNNLNALLSEENRANIRSMLADAATITHTVAGRRADIDSGIANASRTLSNSTRLSAQAGPVLERVGRGADAVQKMGNEVANTSATAGRTVDSVGADVKRFTAETLPELEHLLGELSVLSASLRRLSEQTQRDPTSLLLGHKPVPPGPGETAPEKAKP
jgi:phospholipid/cholesterol/gamma-HCH transport system substrate-binding protein